MAGTSVAYLRTSKTTLSDFYGKIHKTNPPRVAVFQERFVSVEGFVFILVNKQKPRDLQRLPFGLGLQKALSRILYRPVVGRPFISGV